MNGLSTTDKPPSKEELLKPYRPEIDPAFVRETETLIATALLMGMDHASRKIDAAETFFYLDPPYVGTDMGHYDGYSQEDFDALLGLLESIQGKFLLSSFRNKSLAEYARRNKWETLEIKLACSMTSRLKTPRDKVEVLTANYPISGDFFEKASG